ncbi:MAG: tRNA (cytidine(34)-2'-O)-methyltransferase [Candidatus Gastranaerophilales bacterium]|nr:tRNA (cytidine(34)-2'-O)-methyltransferase [Candidatus Gastranaerophilales bacterium]
MKIINKYNIVLFEPEIPQNTGNIARLCACTGARLFLVGRLGFSLDEKHLKRAGLDYWNSVEIFQYENLDKLKSDFPDSTFYYLTTKSKNIYTLKSFKENDFFVFGPETRGLPESLLKENSDYAITIPMLDGQRSLNLSNSAAIVLYEAIRQNG